MYCEDDYTGRTGREHQYIEIVVLPTRRHPIRTLGNQTNETKADNYGIGKQKTKQDFPSSY